MAQYGNQGYGQYNPYGSSNNDNSQSQYGGDYAANNYGSYNPPTGGQRTSTGNDARYGGGEGAPGFAPSERPMASGGGMISDMLEQCSAIDRTITEVESRLQAYKALQSRILSDRANMDELDAKSTELMSIYRNLAARVKTMKQKPDSASPKNAPQIGRLDRRLKAAITEFQQLESQFRSQMRDQQARQYRIVNPTASEQEVREAVEDPNAQIFQQALLNADRRGQAQTTLSAVRQRHEAIQNIERTMMELAELFQDLDVLVMEQEVVVKQIEEKGIEIQDNMVKANDELEVGIKSARGARKKKWCCLITIVVLLIIIGIAVAIYVITQRKNTANSRPSNTTNVVTVTTSPTPATRTSDSSLSQGMTVARSSIGT